MFKHETFYGKQSKFINRQCPKSTSMRYNPTTINYLGKLFHPCLKNTKEQIYASHDHTIQTSKLSKVNTINKISHKIQNFYIYFNRNNKQESLCDHKGKLNGNEFRNSINSVEQNKNEKNVRKTISELNKGS